ncbi:HU family DNA-binding protein, partial [Crocosphaera sp. Alani8]
MNKAQLIKAIAAETGQPQSIVTKILDATTETIVENVANGEKITLVGF